MESGEEVGPAEEDEALVFGKSLKRSRRLRRLAVSMRSASSRTVFRAKFEMLFEGQIP